jgi:signal peptidase I
MSELSEENGQAGSASEPVPVQPSPSAPKMSVLQARQPSARVHFPTLPEVAASLLRLLVVALFLNTFVLQPFVIPSESMERTLLVGDFLLMNKQVYAPAGALDRFVMPYRDVRRGDIVVFHRPAPHPFVIKRVIGLPGDRIRIANGRVSINDVALNEPYAAFEPAPPNQFLDSFPPRIYTDPQVDPDWWRLMQSLTNDGELVVPADQYFMLGDNRNHSKDSRYWGFVSRPAIVARPIVIYFSLKRPSTTDVQQAADDRLGHDGELSARLTGFARWKRIFRVVH